MKPKGYFSRSLLILAGVVVVIFIILITMKFLGMWASFQYETEAEKSAKNLQTAMNRVCASPEGASTTVKINLPQKITTRGAEANPISLLKGIVTGNVGAVSKAMRYMASIDSYGDPWYVIYYEKFPQNEDSGWKGWSEVAATRTSAYAAHGRSLVSCLATAPLFMAGDLFRFGKKATRAVAEEAAEKAAAKEAAEAMTSTAKLRKFTYKLRLATRSPEGEETFLGTVGRKIIEYGKKIGKGVKESPVKIYRWIRGKGVDEVLEHKNLAERVFKESDEATEYFSKIPHGPGRTAAKDALKDIDKIYNGKITNSKFVDTVKGLAKSNRYEDIYRAYGDDAVESLSRYESHLYELSSKERNILNKLAGKLERGEKITDNEFKLIDDMLFDERGLQKFYGADEIYEKFQNARKIAKFQEEMKDIAKEGIDKGKFISDDKPFSYTRLLIGAEGEESAGVLSKLGAAYRLRKGFKGTIGRAGKKIVTREGFWWGSTFVFGSALSLAEISNLKFSPCGSHSLCLKSQVNPSINVYPLEECKQANISHIQLDKHPYGEIVTGVKSAFDSVGNFFTGGSVKSKFYAASPCGGELKIEKGECRCRYEKVPYFDVTTIDLFKINCTIEDSVGTDLDLECNVSRKMLGVENAKTEYLGHFTTSVTATPITIGGKTVYKFTIKLNRKIYKDGSENDILEKYKAMKLNCTEVLSNISAGKKFMCDPITLPAYVFGYGICDGTSDLWLECTNWTKTGEITLEKDNYKGEKIKVEGNRWCCLQWNLSYYPGGINGLRSDSKKIVNVSDCSFYDAPKWHLYNIENIIKTNTENAIRYYDTIYPEINIIDINDYINELKGNITKTIFNSSEVELPKRTEHGEEINLTDSETNKIFMYNLPSYSKTDCLKVKYNAKETEGFCYTSPTGWADAATGVVYGASMAVDFGIQAVADYFTAGGAAAIGAAQAGGCVAGEYVLWFGKNMVSKVKQGNYWPHNMFFKDYFIE